MARAETNDTHTTRDKRRRRATSASLDAVLDSVACKLESAPASRQDAAIRGVLRILTRHFGTDRATILVFAPDHQTFTITHEWCEKGIAASAGYMISVPLGSFPWSTSRLLAGLPLLINTLDDFPPEAAQDRQMLLDENMLSMLAVPMLSRGRVVGTITLDALRHSQRWSPTAVALLRLVGALVAAQLDRRDMEQHMHTVSRMERDKLGRDLHDSLGQNLVAISLLAASLQTSLGKRQAAAAAQAAQIATLTSGVVQTARDLIHGLQPFDFSGDGLMVSLRRMAEETSSLFKIRCRFRDHGMPPVEDREACTQLFWIAREATNNAIRHGKAHSIIISMAPHGNHHQRLSVSDDGKGFDKLATSCDGAGLKVMKFRASALGGQLAIRPGRRRGTVVSCVFPLTQSSMN